MAPTLSGGEAQRIKFTELSNPRKEVTRYILDEPDHGFTFYDLEKLIAILKNSLQKGNTVVVIEHNFRCYKKQVITL